MYIADLSQETYFGWTGPDLRSVGWLDGEHPYARGLVSPEFLATLREHARTAWQPLVYMGSHSCELCQLEKKEEHLESINLWIPGPAVLYLAPAMIVHYIEAHHYSPPDEFIEAVLHCPPQDSPAYQQALQPYLHYW